MAALLRAPDSTISVTASCAASTDRQTRSGRLSLHPCVVPGRPAHLEDVTCPPSPKWNLP